MNKRVYNALRKVATEQIYPPAPQEPRLAGYGAAMLMRHNARINPDMSKHLRGLAAPVGGYRIMERRNPPKYLDKQDLPPAAPDPQGNVPGSYNPVDELRSHGPLRRQIHYQPGSLGDKINQKILRNTHPMDPYYPQHMQNYFNPPKPQVNPGDLV